MKKMTVKGSLKFFMSNLNAPLIYKNFFVRLNGGESYNGNKTNN